MGLSIQQAPHNSLLGGSKELLSLRGLETQPRAQSPRPPKGMVPGVQLGSGASRAEPQTWGLGLTCPVGAFVAEMR